MAKCQSLTFVYNDFVNCLPSEKYKAEPLPPRFPLHTMCACVTAHLALPTLVSGPRDAMEGEVTELPLSRPSRGPGRSRHRRRRRRANIPTERRPSPASYHPACSPPLVKMSHYSALNCPHEIRVELSPGSARCRLPGRAASPPSRRSGDKSSTAGRRIGTGHPNG